MENPPAWSDEEAVALWANEVRDEEEDEEEHKFSMLRWDLHPGIPVGEIHARIVKDVVARAAQGDMRLLNRYLDPQHPMNLFPDCGLGPPIKDTLAPVAERFTGRKTKRGRPKMDEYERRAMNPLHGAADEFAIFKRILRGGYPNQRRGQIYDRALYIVAARFHVRPETLDNHLRRSKRDRRRVQP